MNGTGIEDLSREDLIKLLRRDADVKQQLHFRIGGLMGENVELLCALQELQAEMIELRGQLEAATVEP
jgi:hypothetical protein